MKISIYTAVMIFLFIANGFAQEPTWFSTLRKIEPIKSTEKDVEKIFGKPVKRYANIGEYYSEIGEISVFYSVGKCGTSEESEYDVDEGLVVDFSLLLRKKVKFSSLNVNLVGFKKQLVSDVPGAFSYRNEDLGISYHMDRDTLICISVFPAKNYAYLACPQKAKHHEPITDDVDEATFIKISRQLKMTS